MAKKRDDSNRLNLPITVRQTQKYLSNLSKGGHGMPLVLSESLSVGFFDFQEALQKLAKLASIDPNQVLIDENGNSSFLEPENSREQGDSRPKGTDEVAPQGENPSADSELHGGDGNSGECDSPSQTQNDDSTGGNSGSLENQAQSQSDGGSEVGQGQQASESPDGGDSESSIDGSETGNTSEDQGKSGNHQSSPDGQEAKSGTATENGNATNGNSDLLEDQPRDAASQESSGSQATDMSDAPEKSGEGDRASHSSEGMPEKDVPNPLKGNEYEEMNGTQAIKNGVGESCAQDANAESDQPSDDSPAHQKKWGKSFGSKKGKQSSESNRDENGQLVQSLAKFGVDRALAKKASTRLAALVYDSDSEFSPRRDYSEFCIRLKTFRNPTPARKEEQGKPSILVMADLSGSCEAFSIPTATTTKALGALGVPGCDIITVGTYDGKPSELEVNGKPQDCYLKSDPINGGRNCYPNWEVWRGHDFCGMPVKEELDFFQKVWFPRAIQRYNIQVVIAIGDWQGTWAYWVLAQYPEIQKIIWLDNANCNHVSGRDRTKWALNKLKGFGLNTRSISRKLIYRDGCKDAVAFIKNIKD